jgi:type VI secretion system protein ImpG
MPHPYYKSQLTFLSEVGGALAQAFPRAANMLAGPGLDPDVERLLEGIALFAGQIQEKQDHSLSEIYQLIFDILFPHYLSPVPSAAILQLEGEPCTIPRGTEILSVPVAGTRCRFQTAYDVELPPLNLADVSWEQRSRSASLTLHIEAPPASAGSPDVDLLRLYLHGESLMTRTLLWWLLTRLDTVELLDEQGSTLATADDIRTRPVGLDDHEALFPYPPGSFAGFRLLQEYFTLPQKFLFVDLEGLGLLLACLPPSDSDVEEPLRFSLRLNLRLDTERSFVVTRNNLLIGCTPVVNLFPHTADPIVRDPGQIDYQVRPAGPHLHYQVYRVTGVNGYSRAGVIHYPLFSELDLGDTDGTYCQVYRVSAGREPVTYISLNDAGAIPEHQSVLVDILVSNGMLPSGLHIGDICRPPAAFSHLSCHNVTALTLPGPVPQGEELRRRLVKHLAVSQLDLSSIDGLRDTIDLYNAFVLDDPQVAQAHHLLLGSLKDVSQGMTQHRHEGVPIWGRTTELKVDESAFDTEGELYLFGCILDEITSLLAPLNFFSEFSIRMEKRKERYRWPKRLGRQLLTSS